MGIPLLDHWRNWLKLVFHSTIGVQYDEHPRMFFDSDIKKMFKSHGFKAVETRYVGITKGYGYYKFTK